MGIAIEKKLTEAGYRMLGDDESIEKLILNILKNGNIRYLKAIPFLIYTHKANCSKIYDSCKNEELFNAITAITAKIFNEFNIRGILPEYAKENKTNLAGLSYEEFRDEFELQLRNETKPSLFIDKQKIYAERDLQMHLSQLFTKKEKQIIKRLLEEKPISRTDYEYYSRKTKKKLNSIMGLQDFAKTLYSKTPKYDENLYNLEKKLEELIGKNSKDKISIIEFFRSADEISISYMKENDAEEQLHNKRIELSRIKNKEILNLLQRYEKHNFR